MNRDAAVSQRLPSHTAEHQGAGCGEHVVEAPRPDIEKRVHPHGMRHYFAATMVRRGLQPTFIQQLLGHKNLATTTTYLQGLTNGEAVETARRVAMID